jgi:glyoxylase-like metal-dependent hydrolase (beta-lactamase superfamily II)
MREIVPQVLAWSRLSVPHGYDFNGFLVVAAEGNLCIDPVELDPADEGELVSRGAAKILVTNRNHVRAAARVASLTGAPIAIHVDDAPHARTQGAEIAEEIHPGHRIGPLVVVGVPGKSPGEVAFHWPERRVLVVGDAIIGNPPGHCSLLRDRVVDDPPRLRASVESLLALDFDTLLPGDGAPILSGAHQRLEELVARFPG